MNDRNREDERIAALLRSVRAGADPAVLTRARARLAAEREDGLLGWLMRPAALVGSVVALALASALTVAVLRDAVPATFSGASGLTEALIGSSASPLDEVAYVPGADSAPGDSGAHE